MIHCYFTQLIHWIKFIDEWLSHWLLALNLCHQHHFHSFIHVSFSYLLAISLTVSIIFSCFIVPLWYFTGCTTNRSLNYIQRNENTLCCCCSCCCFFLASSLLNLKTNIRIYIKIHTKTTIPFKRNHMYK